MSYTIISFIIHHHDYKISPSFIIILIYSIQKTASVLEYPKVGAKFRTKSIHIESRDQGKEILITGCKFKGDEAPNDDEAR